MKWLLMLLDKFWIQVAVGVLFWNALVLFIFLSFFILPVISIALLFLDPSWMPCLMCGG